MTICLSRYHLLLRVITSSERPDSFVLEHRPSVATTTDGGLDVCGLGFGFFRLRRLTSSERALGIS